MRLLVIACVLMAFVLAGQVDGVTTNVGPSTASPAPLEESATPSTTVPEAEDKEVGVEQVKKKAAAGYYDFYDYDFDDYDFDDFYYDLFSNEYYDDYYYDDWWPSYGYGDSSSSSSSSSGSSSESSESRRRSESSGSSESRRRSESSESSESHDKSDKSDKKHDCPQQKPGCPRLKFGENSEAGGAKINFDRVADGASVVFKCAVGEVLEDNSGVQYDKVTKTCHHHRYSPNTPSDKTVEELHCVPSNVTCDDPQTLLKVEDDKVASFSFYTTGPQEVGKEISLTCGQRFTRIAVKYDGDATVRVENQQRFRSENILLTCTLKGKWATKTVNTVPRPQPAKSGTVSTANSIVCESENDD